MFKRAWRWMFPDHLKAMRERARQDDIRLLRTLAAVLKEYER